MAISESQKPITALKQTSEQFREEICAIADWWLRFAVDHENGGFYGAVSYDNKPILGSEKCIILNARILWFFSAAAKFTGRKDYCLAAQRAYHYLLEYFVDHRHGGVYWMLNAKGEVLASRKHTYAQAFAIYALSEYFSLTHDQNAYDLAFRCFELIESHAKDTVHNGYFEAFSEDWGALEDIRLSEKEDDSPKTMNTHLHVLEAYTALHQLAIQHSNAQTSVTWALSNILFVFCDRIVNRDTGHVCMFMDEQWRDHSSHYSFGHDIESSWLIQKAMTSLGAIGVDVSARQVWVNQLAEVSLNRGLGANGSMADEYDIASGEFSASAWWVQVEAMVGFANIWVHSGKEQYLEAVLKIWAHVQQYYCDGKHGEWHWFAVYDVAPEESKYKIGPWKAPYHSGRAMMQLCDWFSRAVVNA